ncbi:DUF86 domain-containing protein [Candidatus Latescibacterota bacterium]
MKRRNYILFNEDITESIEKIERYIEGSNFESFKNNELVKDAVFRNLEIIGETSNNIPDEIRMKYTDIQWKRMIGLRNVVIHAYFGIDVSIIWEIIKKNLPDTKPNIIKMLSIERKKGLNNNDKP